MGCYQNYINGGKRTKAWLVARGCEEINSKELKDSPTCTKECLH